MPIHLYKQINDLTNNDLDKYPVWEYLLEDDIHSKDECTVKGYKQGWSNLKEKIVTKAKFELNNGTIYDGFVTPVDGFASSQPVIIIKNKHIYFWHGIMKPTREEIDGFYKSLKQKFEDVFPIKWTCEVELGTVHNGIINGFGYYNSVMDSFDDLEQIII